MMDELLAMLDVEAGGGLVVRRMTVVDWGQTLEFECEYRHGETVAFTLVFQDCREMKWRVYVHAAALDEAAVADLTLGRSGHRSPAHLLTEFFGMSLVYGELVIRRAGEAG
jgi:hypothetical protein